MNKIYQYKNLSCEIKDIDGKKGIVSGYFSAFNNVDSDGDIIRPGAFAKSIAETGPGSARPRIKHLLNHNPSQPLGVIQSLKEDSYGLMYESKIGSHSLGKDFIKMVESGLVSEHSIGFRTIKEEKKDHNEILEVKLFEGSSLTAWGANEMTPLIGLKNMNVDTLSDRIKQIEKFCKETDASDECIESLLIQIKQLTQLVQDLQEPVIATPAIEPIVITQDGKDLALAMELLSKRINII